MCLMLLLLHRIGNFLAFVAALLVAIFWGFEASVAEWLVCETQICYPLSFFSNSRLISIFLDRAAFWSCCRKCLRSAASPLCNLCALLVLIACVSATS